MDQILALYTSELDYTFSKDYCSIIVKNCTVASFGFKVVKYSVCFIINLKGGAIYMTERIKLEDLPKMHDSINLQNILFQFNIGIEFDQFNFTPKLLGFFPNYTKSGNDLIVSYPLLEISINELINKQLQMDDEISELKITIGKVAIGEKPNDLDFMSSLKTELIKDITAKVYSIIESHMKFYQANFSESSLRNNSPIREVVPIDMKKVDPNEQTRYVFETLQNEQLENNQIKEQQKPKFEKFNQNVENEANNFKNPPKTSINCKDTFPHSTPDGDALSSNCRIISNKSSLDNISSSFIDTKKKDDIELNLPVPKSETKNAFRRKCEYVYKSGMRCCISLSVTEYAIGSSEGLIHIRDKETHELIRTLPQEHTNWIYSMILVENQLVSGSNDTLIKIWNLNSKLVSSHLTLKGHSGCILTLTYVKNKIIASGGSDKMIKLWEIEGGTCIRTLKNHTGNVWGLLMHESSIMLSVSADTTIRFWDNNDISNSFELNNRRIQTGKKITCCLKLSKSVVALGAEFSIEIWNVELRKHIKTMTGHTNWIEQIIIVSPNRIGSCSDDKSVRIWNLDSVKDDSEVLELHVEGVFGLLKLNDSEIVSVSRDKTIRVWSNSINES